jgi:hypothetical protein
MRLLLPLIVVLSLVGGTAMAVEEPSFTTTVRDGVFEVREYPSLVAAEVVVSGTRDQAANAGFRALAAYISGGNHSRLGITMTAPVVQAPSVGQSITTTAPVVQTGQDGDWTVRFIMPSKYRLESLPIPNDPRVRLRSLSAARVAVIRFSGLARDRDVAEKTDLLQARIAAHHLHPVGPPELARFDPPWTPWFVRRNEVMIPVQ